MESGAWVLGMGWLGDKLRDQRSGALHTSLDYMGTVNDRTSAGGGQGTETERVVDRVLKARARMKGGRGEEGVGGIG